MPASWHYFEAGHGKGPCDGVGGTTKRLADEAVRQQKATVQSANDFFLWAQAQQASSSIDYLFVSQEECTRAHKAIQEFGDIPPVSGTMKLHAVVPTNIEGCIAVRSTSYFCSRCFNEGTFNTDSPFGWRKHQIKGESV